MAGQSPPAMPRSDSVFVDAPGITTCAVKPWLMEKFVDPGQAVSSEVAIVIVIPPGAIVMAVGFGLVKDTFTGCDAPGYNAADTSPFMVNLALLTSANV